MGTSKRVRQIVIAAGLVVLFALLYKFQEVLPMFVLALFLAYILIPLVVWMSSKKIYNRQMPRGISVIIIYLMLISTITFGGAYFVTNLSNELQHLIKDIPSYGEKLTQKWVPTISEGIQTVLRYLPKVEKEESKEKDIENILLQARKPDSVRNQSQNEFITFLQNTRFEIKQGANGFEVIPHKTTQAKMSTQVNELNLAKYVNNLISDTIENLQTILLSFLDFGQTIVFSVVTSVFQTFITLMIAAFIIIDYEQILDFIKELFPSRFLSRIEIFLQKQNVGLHGVIKGQLMICVVNGTLTGIGLLIFDVKFALTLSLLAMICSLIPIFGTFISSIPIILMAITNSFFTGLAMTAWILLIHFIEANILNPKIIGKSAEIHPVLVILALIAGEKAHGIFGALIAVPIFSILQTTFIFIREIVFDDSSEFIDENATVLDSTPFPESEIYED